MKRIMIGSILSLSFFLLYSQERKQYSGIYELGQPYIQNANATYAYYYKNNQKIFDGAFTFSFLGKNDYKGYNNATTGFYKNGLKSGSWNYITTLNDWYDVSTINVYKTGSISLNISYSYGIANGPFVYKFTARSRTKNIYGNFSTFNPFGNIECRTMFKNGLIVDYFYWKKYDAVTNSEQIIDYKVDNKGFVKSYKETINGNETLDVYENGIKKDENFAINMGKVRRFNDLMKNHPDSLEYLDYKIDTLAYPRISSIGDLSTIAGIFLFLEYLPGDNFYEKSNNEQWVVSLKIMDYFIFQ